MPNGEIAMVWTIISAILAIIGGIVLHFTFLSKKNEGKFKGFWGWMQDFLTFKKMLIENLLRITYLILTVFVTLVSLGMGNFLVVLLSLLLGNLAVRLVYEFSLILLLICRNTTEINKALAKGKIEVKNISTVSSTEENI